MPARPALTPRPGFSGKGARRGFPAPWFRLPGDSPGCRWPRAFGRAARPQESWLEVRPAPRGRANPEVGVARRGGARAPQNRRWPRLCHLARGTRLDVCDGGREGLVSVLGWGRNSQASLRACSSIAKPLSTSNRLCRNTPPPALQREMGVRNPGFSHTPRVQCGREFSGSGTSLAFLHRGPDPLVALVSHKEPSRVHRTLGPSPTSPPV